MPEQLKYLFITLIVVFSLISCTKSKKNLSEEGLELADAHDLSEIIISDTLHVATMRGAVSYFHFRKEIMGYNYELINDFAKHLNINLNIQLVNSEQELEYLLSSGTVDIVAYNLYETKELKNDFHFVFPHFESHQVLIQSQGRSSLSNANDLTGKEVYVKENSIFHKRLKDLNEEIGGTIKIVFVADSLTNDDLIGMVLSNEIPYTTAYYSDAAIHRAYNQKLDYHVPIGFTQRNGWLIRKNTPELLAAFEAWTELKLTKRLQQRLESKYKTRNPYLAGRKIKIPEGAVSPYDNLFKEHAPKVDWDWRLLASLAFHESTFDSASVSPVGAAGLMQLMPRTAEQYGLDSVLIFNPEENIKASVAYLRDLSKLFNMIENKDERIKFILAGYNSGPYHVIDAMSLTEKYGKNPHIWIFSVFLG